MLLLCLLTLCVAEIALCTYFFARRKFEFKAKLLEAKIAMGRFKSATSDDDRQREIIYSGQLILRSSLSALALILLISAAVILPIFLNEMLLQNLSTYFLLVSFWTIVFGMIHGIIDRKNGNELRPS
jgi:hypothetical protein